MSEFMENYVDQQQAVDEEPESCNIATVAQVYADGISLIFPGAAAASVKHYQCNQYCKFAAGNKVYVQKISGTYLVLCPIGAPGTVAADSATRATTAATADIAIGVQNNDDNTRILFSANPDDGYYYMYNTKSRWKRIDNP